MYDYENYDYSMYFDSVYLLYEVLSLKIYALDVQSPVLTSCQNCSSSTSTPYSGTHQKIAHNYFHPTCPSYAFFAASAWCLLAWNLLYTFGPSLKHKSLAISQQVCPIKLLLFNFINWSGITCPRSAICWAALLTQTSLLMASSIAITMKSTICQNAVPTRNPVFQKFPPNGIVNLSVTISATDLSFVMMYTSA